MDMNRELEKLLSYDTDEQTKPCFNGDGLAHTGSGVRPTDLYVCLLDLEVELVHEHLALRRDLDALAQRLLQLLHALVLQRQQALR